MRVAILHNYVSPQDTIEDLDVLLQVDMVSQSLKRLGHDQCTLTCTLDLGMMKEKLGQFQPDVVFNLVETLSGSDSLIYLPPAILDTMGMPYTGSHTESLFLTTNKLLAKQRLSQAGLPTPVWIPQDTVYRANEISSVIDPHSSPLPTVRPELAEGQGEGTIIGSEWRVASGERRSPHLSPLPVGEGTYHNRWIIKNVWEQGSRDMEDEAIFEGDMREVRRRLQDRISRTGRPAFVEQFVEGREFDLAMLTSGQRVEVLPPVEIDFSAFPAGKPRVVGYRAKWQADSFEYHNTPFRFDFPAADQPLIDRLRSYAVDCWKLFMLRGWGRVGFLVDKNGQPWILEINANPCLSPDASFAAALEYGGIDFDAAIQRILDDALEYHRAGVVDNNNFNTAAK